jgi:hypothetical protein
LSCCDMLTFPPFLLGLVFVLNSSLSDWAGCVVGGANPR